MVRLHQAALFRFGHLAHESSRFRVWHDDRIVNLGVERKYIMGGQTLLDRRLSLSSLLHADVLSYSLFSFYNRGRWLIFYRLHHL